MPRPFRFGVIAERFSDREALIRTARAAESAGYATYLVRDHFAAEPFGPQLAPLVTLATVAAVTKTLRVGTLVFDNDYRHPAILAKEVATLDLLSGGRCEFGIGAGWLRAEYKAAGMPYDAPGVRISRLQEAVQVYKQLFIGGRASFAGTYYDVRDLECYPLSAQRPHPPLLIGGGGKRILSFAAREADIVGVLTSSVASGTISFDPVERLAETIMEKIGWIRDAAGERFDALELSLIPSVVVTDDRERAATTYAHERGWNGITTMQVLDMPAVLIGTTDEIVAALHERRERYGFSYFVVTDSDMEAFAPVVARLTTPGSGVR